MRAMTSGDFVADSGRRFTCPVAAYGGLTMWSGTLRIGLTIPCNTRPSSGLWHRLYLRPLPHQHISLAAGSTFGGSGLERTR